MLPLPPDTSLNFFVIPGEFGLEVSVMPGYPTIRYRLLLW